MRLRYRLTGTGWSEAVLEDDDRAVTVSASYLSDALGALARGALAVLRGSGEVRFSFDEEPGEYRWVIRKKDSETYNLTLLEFTDLWANKPDEAGKVIFDRTFSRLEFGRMVLKALEDVRHEHGEEGYKAKWCEHDFPARELAELHSQIEKEKA
jgi:hypothetical protein